MPRPSTLRPDPIGLGCVHLCIDMQRLFSDETEWRLPWMPRVLPQIASICEAHADRTVFTRFVPARRAGEGQGVWRYYYTRWASMTLEAVGPEMVELMPQLRPFAPPAGVFDKPVYSPWLGSNLHAHLRQRGIDTLAVTGGETDVCVLAAVLGAADLGYRTILVQDALCSASDEDHDAMLNLFSRRYGQHVETTTTEEILDRWRV